MWRQQVPKLLKTQQTYSHEYVDMYLCYNITCSYNYESHSLNNFVDKPFSASCYCYLVVSLVVTASCMASGTVLCVVAYFKGQWLNVAYI